MIEAVAALFVFFGSGLAWLAWNHPKAYDAISPYLITVALGIVAMIYGVQVGYTGSADKLEPFLTTQGLVEAEKLKVRVTERTTIVGGLASLSVVAMFLLGGLRFLPRGRD